jgi:hypothetical protein
MIDNVELTGHSKVIFSKKSQAQPENKGRLLVEKMLQAFSVFDLEKISELLPEDCVFEDYSNKYGFLAKYKEIFEENEANNPYMNFPLLAVEGNCHYCALTDICPTVKLVYCFVENDLIYNKLFSLVFELDKKGFLNDMYQCHIAYHPTLPIHMKDEEEEPKTWVIHSNPIISVSMSSEIIEIL